MIVEGDCGAIGGMKIGIGSSVCQFKTVFSPAGLRVSKVILSETETFPTLKSDRV
jgi:hypothetical protein